MRDRTCCFSGHRKIPPEQYTQIAGRLRNEIERLIDSGYVFFGAGGALGFDTMVENTILDLKKEYTQIKLILVLPCKSQTQGWNDADVKTYEDIKSQADKVVYTSDEYSSGCMFKRNRHLVDNSSVCICYLTGCRGGTAYTVDYAKKAGLEIINLA